MAFEDDDDIDEDVDSDTADAWDDDEPWDDDEIDESYVACPACGGEMYDDAPCCPHCGEYVLTSAESRTGWPLWIVLTTLLCLAVAFFLWVLPAGLF